MKPLSDAQVDALPLDRGRAHLLEAIMSEPTTNALHDHRRWLTPVGAAAAVALLAGGAWFVTNGGDDTAPEPADGGGFATQPSETSAGTTPTEESDGDFVTTCGESASADTTTEGAWGDACVLLLEEGDVAEIEEHYQRPLRPMLITAPGWEPEFVDGYDIEWTGPEGQRIRTSWIVTAHPDDPWRYDKPGTVTSDEEIHLLGARTRLGEYAESAEVDHFALTSQVYRDGTSVFFNSESSMSAARFRTVVESARWVSFDEFEQVVRPAAED